MDDGQLVERWLATLEHSRGRSAGTIETYRSALVRLRAFLEARGLSLRQASFPDLMEFTGPVLHALGVRPRSRRPLIAGIRGFYQWARLEGHLATNPAKRLQYPQTGRRLPQPIPLDVAERLLMSIPPGERFLDVRDTTILMVLMGTGLRVSGLVSLNQSALRWQMQRDGVETLALQVREKGDHERLVPVSDEVMVAMHAYLGHPRLAEIDRELPDGDRVLFVNTWNSRVPPERWHGEATRLTAEGVRRMLIRRGRAAGLEGEHIHPHGFRHLFGTELAEADVDPHVRQVLMGHKDLRSTFLYDAVAQHRLRDAVRRGNPLRHLSGHGIVELAAEIRKAARRQRQA